MRRRTFLLNLLAALALLLMPTLALASDEEADRGRKSSPMPFDPAEQLVYEGNFSRLFLRGIKIAEFNFSAARAAATEKTVGKGAVASAPQLLLVGDVKTEGWFHKLFKLDFHFRVESLVERDTFSVLKTTKLDKQGKRARRSVAVFDRTGKQITWTEVDPNDELRPPRIVQSPLDGHVHDIVSAIYFLRTQQLTPGKKFELWLSDSGYVYIVNAEVFAEPKQIKTAVGKVSVVRLDVDLFGEGRPLEGDGKMSIWMTTDARHLPVRARMSSDLGQLDIKLKKYSNGPTPATRQKT